MIDFLLFTMDLDYDQKKRIRGPNFTAEEKVLLSTLATNYKDLLENKKTDHTSTEEKLKCWKLIESEFNALSASTYFRNYKCLRTWYENQKKEVKKIAAKEKAEIYKTGGGKPEMIKRESHHAIIESAMNKKTIVGLDNGGLDGDGIITVKENVVPVVLNYTQPANNEQSKNELHEELQEETVDFIISNQVLPDIKSGNANETTVTTMWDKYTAKNLKQTVSPALKRKIEGTDDKEGKGKIQRNILPSSRRRPTMKIKALTSSEVAEKYNFLLDKKLVIAEYQEQKLKKNITQNDEEHKLKKQLLELQIKVEQEKLKRLTDE